MGWKFSLAGIAIWSVLKVSSKAATQEPLVILVILLSLAILGAFFFGGSKKG